MRRYFAYGSNLNLANLERWCIQMGRPHPLTGKRTAAYLPDHEVVFDYESRSRRGGVLDIRPRPGHVVPGGLSEIVEEDLATLDVKEGVPNLYRQVEKRVLLPDGREVGAVTYEVVPECRAPQPVPPSEEYLRIVAEGLASLGLDDGMLRAAARGEDPPPLVTGLFVYGSHLRGEDRHAELEQIGGIAEIVAAAAPGVLMDCGPIPGMLPGAGTVRGELVEMRDMPAALARLDGIEAFEGFEAARALLRRALVMVRPEGGGGRLAWVYLWAGGENHPRIPSGDWKAWRSAGK